MLTTDSGAEIVVQVQDGARLLRVAPGQKDLKEASAIELPDLHAGDRILARGTLATDGKSLLASSIISMAKTDIAAKQARERDEWQRHGVGGLVSAVDPSGGSLAITTSSLGDKKTVIVHVGRDTVLRRYAPDSTKFDDAKPAPIDEIKPGDQLRARGSRNAEGTELSADEVVSGTFRSIAGTISSIESATATLVVQDLAVKRPVTIKITSDSQLRKLPAPIAQRIAARLKGTSPDAQSREAAGASVTTAPPPNSSPGATGAVPGGGRQGAAGGDLQQMISRMPPATLSELQNGDAVMIVATLGTSTTGPTAITLLAGVEPILQAAPSNTTLLSPWSLGAAPSEPGATP